MDNLEVISEDIQKQSTATLRERLLQGILVSLSIVGLLNAGVGTYEAIQSGDRWLLPFYWVSYFIVLIFTIWKRPGYQIRTWSLVILVYIIGFTDFIADGLGGSGRLFLLTLIFIIGILLSRRENITILIICCLTMIGFGIVFSLGILTTPGDLRSTQPEAWAISTLAFLMLGLLIMISLDFIIPNLTNALQQSRHLAEELQKNQAALTQQVQERTENLSRRSQVLEATTLIGREIFAIQDVDQLLKKSVQLISEQLGYYHVGVFLLDDRKQYALLHAASSEGGQRLMLDRYRVYIGETNLIGSAIARAETRTANYTEDDRSRFDNPELLDTRSAVAIPLKTHDQLLGAIDIQSRQADAFDSEIILTLQILVDQLALSFTNARQYQDTQQNLLAVRRAYGQISRQAWQELISREQIVKRYDPQRVLTDEEKQIENVAQAALQGHMVASQGKLVIPIKERDQVIGVIQALKDDAQEKWSQEEINLMNSLTDQLEVALESARLYKDTQVLAEQERLIGELTSSMRETLDIESVLKIAVQEIGEKLGLSRAEVWLTGDQQ